jgi:Baseplate J-like protein
MSCSCGGACCQTPDGVRNRCDCCAGVEALTPVLIDNPPGRSELAWRVGTHGSFAATMQAEIRRGEALRRLATRRGDDWTIALIDAWASALDVLSFHQERYGQELFLRTAAERRSLLELARLIGYELAPGVAARVALAFTLDAGPGSPRQVTIPAGTGAKSLPQAKDELPQSFETVEDLAADLRFGRLRPRLTADHPAPEVGQRAFWLEGTATGLERGDPLLLVESTATGKQELLRVRTVEPVAKEGRTLVRCDAAATAPRTATDPWLAELQADLAARGSTPGFVDAAILFQWLEYFDDWDTDQLIEWVEAELRGEPDFDPTDFDAPGLFALRVSARPFGHNAPLKAMLPSDTYGAFDGDWDQTGGYPIGKTAVSDTDKGCIHLDQTYPEIVAGSWAVLENHAGLAVELRLREVREESVADFGMSGKASRLVLERVDGSDIIHGDPLELPFALRQTAVHAGAERLQLAPLPIEEIAAATADLLLEEVVPHLEPGRALIVEGERSDRPGIVAREEVRVERVLQSSHTWVFFEAGLEYGYLAQTVTIHGNVAEATHGESKAEVLGSGDASQAHQSFRLRQAPLTWTAAPVPGGAESSLEVRVDGVRWREEPSLYALGPCDRAYTLRRDDDGHTRVQFGDGRRGARLPTGAENLTAGLRVGVGVSGLVAAGRISLLPSPPLGVRAVINPLPSADAEDPETRDRARENAPITVRTLDRVVSLADFEDFARTWAGVDKARADFVWDGHRRVVHLTLAGIDGAVPSDDLLKDLCTALAGSRDVRPPVRLAPYRPVRVAVEARLLVDADYVYEDVEAAAGDALTAAFGYGVRRLGQPLRRAEVMAVLHEVAGIVAIDVDGLHVTSGSALADEHGLQAAPARWVSGPPGELVAAQLLYLAPGWAEPLRLSPLR